MGLFADLHTHVGDAVTIATVAFSLYVLPMTKKAGKLKVMKFGGTSMGSVDALRQVISIIRKQQRGVKTRAVVVSAMSGVTDQLIQIGRFAAQKDDSYKKLLRALEERHVKTLKTLVSKRYQKEAMKNVRILTDALERVVRGIYLVRELSPGALDYLMSYGERLSAHILADALRSRGVKAEYASARYFVVTDNSFGEAGVDFEKTNVAIRKHFKTHPALQIVTGFIGATAEGRTTTLGRGGSDYSASIVGAALGASVIEIWTDVSGVMTADPRKVRDALPVAHLSYSEAAEMSYFGAKVIHPPTMRPAELKSIPILIKNTFEPGAVGTVIGKGTNGNNALATGITSINDVSILQVEGSGMVRTRGASGRLFGALSREKVNVILITQASSQHSITIAVSPKDADHARHAIDEEFALERAAGLIDNVVVRKGYSIIAVVGERLRHKAGIAGRMFATLGKNGISVSAIAQGSSELNISVVVGQKDEAKALNAIHTGFFFPETKYLNVFLVGTGLIGGTVLSQIAEQNAFLKKEYGYVIRVVGLGDKNKMAFDAGGIDSTKWRARLTASKQKMSTKRFIEEMKKIDVPDKVFVDCTASEEVAFTYADLLRARISVVTPNKKAASGTMDYYRELERLAKTPGVTFLYETNVGAALPIISTLNDLYLSGDEVLKIEAVLSGSLSYVFNEFKEGKRFSEIVREARANGYTEPDPREDLSGRDVARKILILARETGADMELSDVHVESLLSNRARSAKSVDDFLKILVKDDVIFEKRRAATEKKGMHLRYIATLEKGKAKVALRAVSPEHPFYNLSGSDNIIAFTTKRYKKTPLVVKGPGAGASVTAAGVFADILRTAHDLS